MNYQYVTREDQLPRAFTALSGQRVLGVDIETAPRHGYSQDKQAGLDPYKSYPRLVSVATQTEAYVFDMLFLHPAALAPLASTPWVAHNALFEWRHLTHQGYILPDRLHDTQLMGRPLHHNLLSLADLTYATLGETTDKTLQTSDWSGRLSNAQLAYAANDALVTARLAYKLLEDLNKNCLGQLYDLYRRTIPVIGQQMLTGLHFDWDEHHLLHQRWLVEQDRLGSNLKSMLGDINPRSSRQLGDWLARRLTAKVLQKWPRTSTGCLSTSAETLARYADIAEVQVLLRYKVLEKLIGTYGKGYEKHRHPITNNLHPTMLIAGTAGGRFACRNPNVQNPPRDTSFRQLFCAEPGRALVAADFSQIELRVAALLSEDPRMLEAYANGEDLHRVTAAAIAGVNINEVTPQQRQAAKAVNFGNLYQQRPKGLAGYAKSSYGVDMNPTEAAHAQAKFFRAYPRLLDWQRRRILEARAYGLVHTRMGLARDFNLRRGYLEAEACNHPIQGSAGEILLASLAKLPVNTVGIDARLYNHVHDEIILSVAARDRDAAAQALEKTMTEAFLEVFPEGAPLLRDLVEVKTGRDWGEVK